MPSFPASGSSIAFGVVPDVSDAETRAQFEALCAELSAHTGASVVPRLAHSPAELASLLAAGSIQLAWVSPTLLLTSSQLARAVPLVSSVRQGQTAFHGAVFVRDDSPIRSLLDLRGKHAAWVAPTSASGYLFPRLVLAGHGIDPSAFFASETFHHSHGNVAKVVLGGQADVGGVHAVFEGGDSTKRLLRAPFLDNSPPGVSARIVFTTPPIPSDLIIASHALPVAVRAALATTLASLGDSDTASVPMLHIFGAESFVRFDPRTLESLREQVGLWLELGMLV
jgi:phosphonate transport system substrate-binding protein